MVAALPDFDDILILIRLGGFHATMSFMGSIGYIMSGSGIQDALCLIFAENCVNHILSGHAYARALRAHTLMHQALSQTIFDNLKINCQEF